ncbi:hypothetical protein M0R45_035402 [Rubus argutus]|uniref:Transposase n=1 Tax=Rubus argutus TaxID=59490 RepID=A0AAW1VXE5_RUBAR
MDKEWASYDRNTPEYKQGARKFVDTVQANLGNPEKIRCPCISCRNGKRHNYNIVYDHLIVPGINPLYTKWIFHGEETTSADLQGNVEIPEIYRMFKDACFEDDDVQEPTGRRHVPDYENLLEEAELPIYTGSTWTKMSATVACYKFKARHSLSNTGFDELLEMIHSFLPKDNILPNSLYSTKKLLKAFDLAAFDGTQEHRLKPRQLTGSEIFEVVKNIKNDWGKKKKKKKGDNRKKKSAVRKRKRDGLSSCDDDSEDDGDDPMKLTIRWKKKSIFFELPYWQNLLLHHNLDMMHIEKNIFHLVQEVLIGGPVHLRWMFPFERYVSVLNHYVKNRSNPEGCIAENYLAEEITHFCSGYIQQAADIGVQYKRNEVDEDETILEGQPFGRKRTRPMTSSMLEIAHRYVLTNTTELDPWKEIHKGELKLKDGWLAKNESLLEKKHWNTFSDWLSNRVRTGDCGDMSSTTRWIACKPRRNVLSCSGYKINGNRFHTREAEKVTQNSGVSVEAYTQCRASARDTMHRLDRVQYYGVIKEIILLDYRNFKVPLFDCEWANIGNGVKVEDGFTLVNLHQGQHQFQRDPFIFASQAKQVFYSRDSDTSNWYVVLRAPPRGFYENDNFDENDYMPTTPLDVSQLGINFGDEDYTRSQANVMTDVSVMDRVCIAYIIT